MSKILDNSDKANCNSDAKWTNYRSVGPKRRKSRICRAAVVNNIDSGCQSFHEQKFDEREIFYGIERFVSINVCKINLETVGQYEEEIDLSFLPVQNSDMIHIASRSKSLISVDLSYCLGVGDLAIEHLIEMKNLTKLNLAGCNHITDKACYIFKMHLHFIRFLDISECGVTDVGIIQILEGCLYLESFCLSNVLYLGDRAVRAIQTNISLMKLLSRLNFAGCIHFTNESLISLLEHGGSVIRELDLSRCIQIDLGLIGFRRNFTCTSCCVLKLSRMTGICDATMNWLAEGCGKLQCLDLSSSRCVTDSSLICLANGCTRLKEINLSKCIEITDNGLIGFISVSGYQLKTISLRNCSNITDKSIEIIAQSCKKLENLDIFGVPRVTDIGLESIAKYCRWLKALDFSSDVNSLDSSRKARVPRIGSKGVASLGQYCRQLIILNCRGAAKLDSNGLMGLSRKCHNLLTLSVRYCFQLCNKAIIAIANQCHYMRNLDIGCCVKITDPAIVALSKGCREIEKLNFHGLKRLTDKSILSLSRGCKKLTKLILHGCERLTDVGICGILERCRFLIEIDLCDIGNVTDISVNEMAKCHLLRRVNFCFTEVSNQNVFILSEKLPFASKAAAKMLLEPVHTSHHEYEQFVKYHSFLSLHQRNMSKVIRAFICKRAYERWRNLALKSCKRIQKCGRKFLATRQYLRSRMKHAHLSLQILVFMHRYQKMKCGKIINALTIQNIARRYLYAQRFKPEKELIVKACQEELSLKIKAHKEKELIQLRANELIKQEVISNIARNFIISVERILICRRRWRRYCIFLLARQRSFYEQSSCEVLQRWWLLCSMCIRYRKRLLSAKEIQKIVRGFLSLQSYRAMVQKRNSSSFIIQNLFRSYLNWQKILADVIITEKHHKIRYELSLTRTFVVKQYWDHLLKEATNRVKFADKKFILMLLFDRHRKLLQLQAGWRRYCAQKISTKIRRCILRWAQYSELVFVRQKIQNAAIIQKWIRLMMWQGICRYASIRIQSFWRFYQASVTVNMLRLEFQSQSAQKIQLCYRKCIGRCYRNYWWWIYDEAIRMIQKTYRQYRALDTVHNRIRKLRSLQNIDREQNKNGLILSKYERRFRETFSTRDNKAARMIQKNYRSYSDCFKLQEAKRLREKMKGEKLEEERSRRAKIQVKKASKESNFRGKLQDAVKKAKEITINQKGSLHQNKSILKKASFGRKNSTTLSDLMNFPWYSTELDHVIENTSITPSDITKMHTVYEKLDFLKEDVVDTIDLLEMIGEPFSTYVEWILALKGLSLNSRIQFHRYVDFIYFLCMLSREDVLRILFSSMDLSKRGFLDISQWRNYIDIMTKCENIVHCTKGAVDSFGSFSETIGYDKESKLFYDGFVNITHVFSFLVFPAFRFQAKTRETHFGRGYWNIRAKS